MEIPQQQETKAVAKRPLRSVSPKDHKKEPVRLYIQRKEEFEENLKRQKLAEAEKVKDDIERKLRSLDELIDGLESELLPAQG